MGPGCFYPGNMLPRPSSMTTRPLQWGRDVSIPEIWRSPDSPMIPTGFNGAGMFLSRKSGAGRWWMASMMCFNGAGMFLSRKCRGMLVRQRPLRRFNGAGMFLSRK